MSKKQRKKALQRPSTMAKLSRQDAGSDLAVVGAGYLPTMTRGTVQGNTMSPMTMEASLEALERMEVNLATVRVFSDGILQRQWSRPSGSTLTAICVEEPLTLIVIEATKDVLVKLIFSLTSSRFLALVRPKLFLEVIRVNFRMISEQTAECRRQPEMLQLQLVCCAKACMHAHRGAPSERNKRVRRFVMQTTGGCGHELKIKRPFCAFSHNS